MLGLLLALLLQPAVSEAAPKKAPPGLIDWVELPGGSFTMGSRAAGADARPRRVSVKPFSIARTEVTRSQYASCVSAGACREPFCDWPPGPADMDRPVVCVGWEDAAAFSAWAGGRLPSEAEWEYAARGAGPGREYPWGGSYPDCGRAALSSCCVSPLPVCSRPAGNTPQGVCDMSGNVWEWVRDWYHPSYEGAPADGSARENPPGPYRVNRGGACGSIPALGRAAYRRAPGLPGGDLGFRPARDPDSLFTAKDLVNP